MILLPSLIGLRLQLIEDHEKNLLLPSPTISLSSFAFSTPQENQSAKTNCIRKEDWTFHETATPSRLSIACLAESSLLYAYPALNDEIA